MARGSRRSSSRSSGPQRYPRAARLNETLREVIAEELVRIQDERLEFVTITSIDVDNELNRAFVYFDSLAGADSDAEIIEVLGELRPRIQASVGRQMRTKKTPVLEFRADEVLRSAERIDDILRADRERQRGVAAPGDPDADDPGDPDADDPGAGDVGDDRGPASD